MAIVARNLILKYPQVLEITKKPTSTFAGMTITSTNFYARGYARSPRWNRRIEKLVRPIKLVNPLLVLLLKKE